MRGTKVHGAQLSLEFSCDLLIRNLLKTVDSQSVHSALSRNMPLPERKLLSRLKQIRPSLYTTR